MLIALSQFPSAKIGNKHCGGKYGNDLSGMIMSEGLRDLCHEEEGK